MIAEKCVSRRAAARFVAKAATGENPQFLSPAEAMERAITEKLILTWIASKRGSRVALWQLVVRILSHALEIRSHAGTPLPSVVRQRQPLLSSFVHGQLSPRFTDSPRFFLV